MYITKKELEIIKKSLEVLKNNNDNKFQEALSQISYIFCDRTW